jgi:hypothetical protein
MLKRPRRGYTRRDSGLLLKFRLRGLQALYREEYLLLLGASQDFLLHFQTTGTWDWLKPMRVSECFNTGSALGSDPCCFKETCMFSSKWALRTTGRTVLGPWQAEA